MPQHKSGQGRVCGSRCLGPMTFHAEAKGRMVTLSEGARRASRDPTTSKHGLAFSCRPVKVQEKIRLRVERSVTSWEGGLRVGFTNVSPGADPLPDASLPHLSDVRGYCVAPVPEAACLPNTEIQFWMNYAGCLLIQGPDGKMYYMDTKMKLHYPLWALIDIYGNTTTVCLLGSEKKEYLRIRTSCPAPPYLLLPQGHRDAQVLPERREISTEEVQEVQQNTGLPSPTSKEARDRRKPGREATLWRVKLFLLQSSNQKSIPSGTECSHLTAVGLGIPLHESPGGDAEKGFVNLDWTRSEFIQFICSSFPLIELHAIGFGLARADRFGKLFRIDAYTLRELKKKLGQRRLFIIPQVDIILPTEITGPALPCTPLSPTLSSPCSPLVSPSGSLSPVRDSGGPFSEDLPNQNGQISTSRRSRLLSTRDDDSMSEEIDASFLLRMFRHEHPSAGEEVLSVTSRTKLVQSAITFLSRKDFSWTHIPRIEFVNEEALDFGGPRREFFRLLMIEVQSSLGIFEGRPGHLIFTYDQRALDKQKYCQAGKLIAWSLIHDGPGIKALEPCLYQLMCDQEAQLEDFDWNLIPDGHIQKKVRKILKCKTTEDLHRLQRDLGDWICACGFPGIFSVGISIKDVQEIYAYVVRHYIFLRTSNMIEQFTVGLNSFGKLWNMVKTNWVEFLPVFCDMQEPISRNSFKDLFRVDWSNEGTRKREAEEETVYSWEKVLNIIENKEANLSFEELLIFITGADEIPVLGFPQKPSINFYDQEKRGCRLPFASTCMMGLFLPRGVRSESELLGMLLRAVKDSDGFGRM